MTELVEVGTLRDAIILLDGWTKAYKRDVRARTRQVKAANDSAFWAKIDADIWRHQAFLYRAQLLAAGVVPLDALPDVGVIAAGVTIA